MVVVRTLVEFDLIEKQGATLRTLLIVITTVTIPVILAIVTNVWWLQKSERQLL